MTDSAGPAGSAGMVRLMEYGVEGLDVAEDAGRAKERFMEVAGVLGAGDRLVVCSLKDICRGVEELLEVLLVWSRRKFMLVSLDEDWLDECRDVLCQGSVGVLLGHLHRFAPALAETQNAKRRPGEVKAGMQGGRPKGSIKMNAEKLDLAVRMYCQGDFTVRDICDIVRCNERSMYRYLKLRGVAGMRKTAGHGETVGEEGVNMVKDDFSGASEN